MDQLHLLLKEITELTTTIESAYPELYKFLNENPLTIPAGRDPIIDESIMQDYLQSLKELLQHHQETHDPRI